MKNINLNINTNAIPPAYPTQAPTIPNQALGYKQTYSISFSAQFENEAECLKFAAMLLNMATGDNE